MATPEKLYFSTALEIGAGGLLCSTASLQNVSVIIAKQVSHITHYKIVVYFGSITSRDSNQLPHDSHCDVLPTALRTGCS